MTTTHQGENRPLSDRISDALTITLAATDLLEQIALGRLERSLGNLSSVSESLHQAASLISQTAQYGSRLSEILTDAMVAAELLNWAVTLPDTLTPDRRQLTLAMLYRASDGLAMVDRPITANTKEARP